MKVSIIVPVYNVEDYLDECVNSLINQTMQEIQIILVDDGSSDQSGKMIDDYAASDNRVVAVHKENGGQSSARNFGLKHASGEYVLYVDSDDYIIPETCQVLYTNAQEQDADIIHGDMLNEAETLKKNSSFRRMQSDGRITKTESFLKEKIKTGTYDIVPWLYMVKREFLIKNQLFFAEGYYYEDQLYTMELLACPGKILKIRFPFYFYRMDRPGSTTNVMSLKKATDAAYICGKMLEQLEKISEDMQPYFQTVCMISLYQYYSVYLRLRPADRKVAWRQFDFVKAFQRVQNCGYYENLKAPLMHFVQHRYYHTMRRDFLCWCRKQRSRLLNK